MYEGLPATEFVLLPGQQASLRVEPGERACLQGRHSDMGRLLPTEQTVLHLQLA